MEPYRIPSSLVSADDYRITLLVTYVELGQNATVMYDVVQSLPFGTKLPQLRCPDGQPDGLGLLLSVVLMSLRLSSYYHQTGLCTFRPR